MKRDSLSLPFRLNASQINLLGCLFMFIDHIGALLFPEQLWLRCLGRVSFPLFAFMLANGYRHTHDRGRYLLRLTAFGLLFQPLYAFCMQNGAWNIFLTLAAGMLAIMLHQACRQSGRQWLGLAAVAILALAAEVLHLEYGWYGIALIFTAHLYFEDFQQLAIAWLLLNLVILIPLSNISMVQVYSIFALLPLRVYNGERGRGGRWFFYFFYCLHIPALYILGRMLV